MNFFFFFCSNVKCEWIFLQKTVEKIEWLYQNREFHKKKWKKWEKNKRKQANQAKKKCLNEAREKKFNTIHSNVVLDQYFFSLLLSIMSMMKKFFFVFWFQPNWLIDNIYPILNSLINSLIIFFVCLFKNSTMITFIWQKKHLKQKMMIEDMKIFFFRKRRKNWRKIRMTTTVFDTQKKMVDKLPIESKKAYWKKRKKLFNHAFFPPANKRNTFGNFSFENISKNGHICFFFWLKMDSLSLSI